MSLISPYKQTQHPQSFIKNTVEAVLNKSMGLPETLNELALTYSALGNQNRDDLWISAIQSTSLNTPEAAEGSIKLLCDGSDSNFLKMLAVLTVDDESAIEGFIKYNVFKTAGVTVDSLENRSTRFSTFAFANQNFKPEERKSLYHSGLLFNPNYQVNMQSLLFLDVSGKAISSPCIDEELVLYWTLEILDFMSIMSNNDFMTTELRLAALSRSENIIKHEKGRAYSLRLIEHVKSGIITALTLPNLNERDKLIKHMFNLFENSLPQNRDSASSLRCELMRDMTEQGYREGLLGVIAQHDTDVYEAIKDIDGVFLAEMLHPIFEELSIPSSDNIFQAVEWEPWT